MGGPFRSESEQLREQLRRAADALAEAEADKADLQRRVDLGGRSRRWRPALIVSIATGMLGYLTATRVDASASAHARGARERRTQERLDACSRKDAASKRALETQKKRHPCACHPADPLCSCL